MEQLIVFYRIFHADLSPSILPSIAQKKEYQEFLNHYANIPGYPTPEGNILLPDHLLRFHYYQVLLHKIVKEIEAELYQNVFVRGENEQKMKIEVIKLQRYINMHLTKIRNDFISAEQQQEILQFSEAKDAVDIYKLAYKSLVDLHEYLEATFRHYLDEHIVVPCEKRKRFIEEQRLRAEHALNAVKNHELAPKLKEQVGGTIERFLSDGFDGFTYAQMHYCSKLNKALNKFFDGSTAANEEGFIFLLIQINFNRNGVLQYIFEYLKEQLAQKKDYCQQLEILTYYLKRINRIQHSSTFAYNEKLCALKHHLAQWIDQKIQKISLKDIKDKDHIGVATKQPVVTAKKYKINLSVPESALLLRIFKNTQIIDIPKDDLFEYFSTHFNTKQSTNVSTSSLAKKYHDPSEKNLKTVREALQQCLCSLDEIESKLLK